MIFLAKAALGLAATLALAGTYVFHEGVIHVSVDENHINGSHVHLWMPATVVPVGLRFVPDRKLQKAAAQARPYLPVLREISKELEKYPDADLVEVRDSNDHVRIGVHSGKVYIDAVSNGDDIHVSFPVETLSDVTDRLEEVSPAV